MYFLGDRGGGGGGYSVSERSFYANADPQSQIYTGSNPCGYCQYYGFGSVCVLDLLDSDPYVIIYEHPDPTINKQKNYKKT
jgi:hypothetical protein